MSLRWVDVAVGERHVCMVSDEGSLYCFGDGASGQLGAQWDDVRGPTRVEDVGAGWTTVAAGATHSCAVNEARDLLCFGLGRSGELGVGGNAGPVPPSVVEPAGAWLDVFAAGPRTCGAAVDGELFCWGANDHAQAGVESADLVDAPSLVGGRIDWGTSVAMGADHTCAVAASGEVWCWGYDSDFRLGLGSDGGDVATPVALFFDAASIGGPRTGTVAALRDGTLRRWGLFYAGIGYEIIPPEQVGDRSDWRVVARGPGRAHTCVLDADGRASCLGAYEQGQLGTEAGSHLQPVEGGGAWSAIAVGGDQSCAIARDDASLWCWGDVRISTDADVCPLDAAELERSVPSRVCGVGDG